MSPDPAPPVDGPPSLALGAERVDSPGLASDERLHVARCVRSRGGPEAGRAAAFVDLARFCVDTGREFEALAAARYAEARFEALDQGWGVARARLHRGEVIRHLCDWVRLPAATAAVEMLLPRLSDREAGRLRVPLHELRAHEALSRGRVEDVFLHADVAEACADSVATPRALLDPRALGLLRTLALLVARRHEEAVACADRALAGDDVRDVRGLRLRLARLAARVGLGVRSVEDEARALLDDCVAGQATLGAGRCRELATGVAHALAPLPPALRTMRRAFDVAATAAFERAAEVERFVRDLPEAAVLPPEDADTLSDHRRATLSEQDALGTAVVLALERAAEEGRVPLPMFGDADGLTCVCAWCQRVRTRDGLWLTVQQFLPLRSAGPVQLTHGICDACVPALAAQAEASTG